jgi:hypothetical protein
VNSAEIWLREPRRTTGQRANFGVIGDQKHLARVAGDRLRGTDLVVVAIRQRPIRIRDQDGHSRGTAP